MRNFRVLAWLLFIFTGPTRGDECSDLLDQVTALFAAKDPALLTVDIMRGGCTGAVLYEAAYYQGFAFYILSEKESALADLELARSLGGPWDEQILYYIWKIRVQLKDRRASERARLEMRSSFPASRYLREMDAAASEWASSWEGSAMTGLASLHGGRSYRGEKSRTYLRAAREQEKEGLRLQEFAAFSGNFAIDHRDQHFAGLEAGAELHWRDFSLTASQGRLYSIYRMDTSASAGGDPQTGSRVERRWEWQRSLMASREFSRPGGWVWTASLNYDETGEAILDFGKRASFASLGAGWDMDRFRKADWISHQYRIEYQGFDADAGCRDQPGLATQCEASRLGAAEIDWRYQRFLGRNVLGAAVKGRGETSVLDTAFYRRGVALAGAEYAFRFTRKIKWTAACESGADADVRKGSRAVIRPVINVTTSVSMRF